MFKITAHSQLFFREDDKQCTKLFSDPGMFFEIWKDKMIESMKQSQMARRETRKSKKAKGIMRKDVKIAKIVTIAVSIKMAKRGRFDNYFV